MLSSNEIFWATVMVISKKKKPCIPTQILSFQSSFYEESFDEEYSICLWPKKAIPFKDWVIRIVGKFFFWLGGQWPLGWVLNKVFLLRFVLVLSTFDQSCIEVLQHLSNLYFEWMTVIFLSCIKWFNCYML